MIYLNEYDRTAASWLRQLMADGQLPSGTVDERSIVDVNADDLRGYRECHFFAGIGGWPYALRLAGWPAGREVWTGSCPCQPYSSAGKGLGDADPRNLWPAFFRLIRECRPATVFGEQVEGAVKHGWLDRVSTDLESEGYACGAVVLGAHSVGAPHIRQRLYWLADRSNDGAGGDTGTPGGLRGQPVDARTKSLRQAHGETGASGADSRSASGLGGMGDTAGVRSCGGSKDSGRESPEMPWEGFDLLDCQDGKSRRVEPGTFPLAHGIPGRVGLLRGYGNAIVPQVAAAFIRAFLESEGG